MGVCVGGIGLSVGGWIAANGSNGVKAVTPRHDWACETSFFRVVAEGTMSCVMCTYECVHGSETSTCVSSSALLVTATGMGTAMVGVEGMRMDDLRFRLFGYPPPSLVFLFLSGLDFRCCCSRLTL
jgi:hypothetical protein